MSTLATIRGNVRANLAEQSPKFWTNADLNRWIGEAYKKYFLMIIQNGEGFFEKQVDLPLVQNDPEIDLSLLSPVFFKVASVERNTQQARIPLKPSERRFVANPLINVGTGNAYFPTYRLLGMKMLLEPTPQNDEAASDTSGIRLSYIYLPDFPKFDSPDNFEFNSDFPTGYEPMVELYATISALESKDGMGGVADISSFRERLKYFEKSFEDSLERFEYPDFVQYSGVNYNNPFYWQGWR